MFMVGVFLPLELPRAACDGVWDLSTPFALFAEDCAAGFSAMMSSLV